ncbi:hypothetical protein [Microscilla marina]|uniref:Uncharacterized protein n=1 Tax=Microscilla marina ATCC 23134 TaxID=313606 RepID=A1ZIZ5_MICM2|nr:hypothetical protein [Microscilla marina]EAY29531.1 hypothetical protein M23134_00415 [Microscilla marina ATCC 23134]
MKHIKKTVLGVSTLALVVLFTTAMISRSVDKIPVKAKTTLIDKKDRVQLSSRGRLFVHENLTKPLARRYKVNLKRQMISRCPSGLRYAIYESPAEASPYFVGKMRLYSGCKGKVVCEFRVNTSEDKIEVFQEDKQRYVAVSNWILASSSTTQQAQKN